MALCSRASADITEKMEVPVEGNFDLICMLRKFNDELGMMNYEWEITNYELCVEKIRNS